MSNNNNQLERLQSAPSEGQMYIPPQYYAAQDDEIDLRELFGVLWKGKWWIIGITALFGLVSVLFALWLPNEYKATAIVAPASSDSSGNLGKMAGQLGGLVSLAGINLGGGESDDATIAMEIMKTWGFQEKFITEHELQIPIFAAKGWSRSENKLVLDDKLYDVDQNKWIRDAPAGKTVEPTSWELYEVFSQNLSISQNKNSGLIKVSYMHYSPSHAQKIVSWLIKDVNTLMKKKALVNADKNIRYLEEQISKTSLTEMQEVFYSLIKEQTKTKMLAELSDEYVFTNVSMAQIPEQKSKPKRSQIVIMLTLFGFIVSVLIVFLLNSLREVVEDAGQFNGK